MIAITMQRSTQLTVAGTLMIIASIVSLILGLLLLDSYNSSIGHKYISYSELYGSILNLVAIPFELTSGVLLLKQKSVRLAVVTVVFVLAIGLACPVILDFEGYLWETGLLFGLPMIVFSAVALTFAILGQRNATKQQVNP